VSGYSISIFLGMSLSSYWTYYTQMRITNSIIAHICSRKKDLTTNILQGAHKGYLKLFLTVLHKNLQHKYRSSNSYSRAFSALFT